MLKHPRTAIFYYLDLLAVAVFAASGVLAARDRNLDLLGVIVVAAITGIGGGTLRDLLLDRHPIFWVADVWYLVVIITSAVITVGYMRIRPPPRVTLQVADAFGLALFALSGVQLAQAAQHSPLIVVRMEKFGLLADFTRHRNQPKAVAGANIEDEAQNFILPAGKFQFSHLEFAGDFPNGNRKEYGVAGFDERLSRGFHRPAVRRKVEHGRGVQDVRTHSSSRHSDANRSSSR